jgi:hypothetical protein
MVGKSFHGHEFVRFLEQLNDCLSKSKESRNFAQIADCLGDAKKISDALKYSDCINNSKYVHQFSECSKDITKECRRGDFTLPSDFKESIQTVNSRYEKLLEHLDNVLKNEELLTKDPEVFLSDEGVRLIFDDVGLLHCSLMKFYDQCGMLVEIFDGLCYTGFLCSALVLTFMFVHYGGISWIKTGLGFGGGGGFF